MELEAVSTTVAMVGAAAPTTVVEAGEPIDVAVSWLPRAPVSLMIVPPAGGDAETRTVIRTDPAPPAGSAPIGQVTTPTASDPPAADTKVVSGGTRSVITTPVRSVPLRFE